MSFCRSNGKHLRTAALVMIALAGGMRATASDSAQRLWTSEDSVAMRYFTHEGDHPFWSFNDQPAQFSPDGKHFFVISRRGLVSEDVNEYEMRVYSIEAVLDCFKIAEVLLPKPAPLIVRRVRTQSSVWSGMGGARWVDDSTIVFSSELEDEPRNIFSLSVPSGEFKRLTDVKSVIPGAPMMNGVGVFEVVRGGSALFNAPVGPPAQVPPGNTYPAAFIDNSSRDFSRALNMEYALYGAYQGGPARIIARSGFPVSISPDGRWGVIRRRPEGEVPVERWAGYVGAKPTTASQFLLWDFAQSKGIPFFDAPDGTATTDTNQQIETYHVKNPWARLVRGNALWLPDSAGVILVNTALPLERSNPRRQDTSYIVRYSVIDGTWQTVAPLVERDSRRRVNAVHLLEKRSELLISYKQIPEGKLSFANLNQVPLVADVYDVSKGVKLVRHVPPELVSEELRRDEQAVPGMQVSVVESANEPQRIVARFDGREIEISDRDPVLVAARFAPAQLVEWTEPDGKKARGLLYLPPRSEGSPPPPVVIQAYHCQPGRFRPDGPYPTAYAAQSLVSAGFAVVNIDIPTVDRPEATNTPREGELLVSRIDALLDEFGSSGLIDPERWGLVGFSRGGFLTYYAITHPGRRYCGAAIIADSYTASIASEMRDASGSMVRSSELNDTEIFYGNTFAKDPSSWLRHDPSLNASTSRTPTLFCYNGNAATSPMAIFGDTVGAFRMARRPADFLFFPTGTHQLARPKERLASLTATVDWMRFWLKGEIPADPERAARWAILRKLQDEVLKTPPPPKGKWQFVSDAEQPAWTPPENVNPDPEANSAAVRKIGSELTGVGVK